MPKNDNTTLNALLSAEYDAIATYTAGAGIIAADSATAQATRDTVTAVAVHFRDQHTQHAAALPSSPRIKRSRPRSPMRR
jgi:Ferritin-like domain